MPSKVDAGDKRPPEGDPGTPPQSKCRNSDAVDPENVTLLQLQQGISCPQPSPQQPEIQHQVKAPPNISPLATFPNLAWQQSLVGLRLIVADGWWPGYTGDAPNPGEIVGWDPEDIKMFYFPPDPSDDSNRLKMQCEPLDRSTM